MDYKRKAEILESGKYAKVEILIPEVKEDIKEILNGDVSKCSIEPVVHVENKGVGILERTLLINSMEKCIKMLKKREPAIDLFEKLFDTTAIAQDEDGNTLEVL